MRRQRSDGSVVVFAVPDYVPAVGGTSRQVGLQTEALARRGHAVEIVTRRLDRSWARHEVINGIPVHRIGGPGHGRRAAKMAALALGLWLARHRRRIQVYQPVMWTDGVYGAWLARLLPRTAIIWAIKGDVKLAVETRPGLLRWIQGNVRRHLIERCLQVVLTPSMAAEVDAEALETETQVIPVPVDLRAFRQPTAEERADARQRLGIAPDAFVVVYAGHLQTRKAVDRLIDAMADLRAGCPTAHLLLVGGGRGAADDTEDQLREQVARLGLEDAVTFAGVVQHPTPLLWAADVFVLPSIREGMPNSILEAMGCGLPCVAPLSAGGGELLTPETGIVPPSNAPEHLHEALLRLARDRELRARMSAAAVAQVRRYDIEHVAGQYEQLYARMATNHR